MMVALAAFGSKRPSTDNFTNYSMWNLKSLKVQFVPYTHAYSVWSGEANWQRKVIIQSGYSTSGRKADEYLNEQMFDPSTVSVNQCNKEVSLNV